MHERTHETLLDRLSVLDCVVEIGIGRRPAFAGALADTGPEVRATDIRDRSVPPGVSFFRDDITEPDRSIYADADALYALNLPPDLQKPCRVLACELAVPLLFTTLGADPVVVPATRQSLPRETLYTVCPDNSSRRLSS